MTTQGQEDQDCNLMKVTGQAVAKVTVMDALIVPAFRSHGERIL